MMSTQCTPSAPVSVCMVGWGGGGGGGGVGGGAGWCGICGMVGVCEVVADLRGDKTPYSMTHGLIIMSMCGDTIVRLHLLLRCLTCIMSELCGGTNV